MQILFFNFFISSRIGILWSPVSPHTILYFESKSTKNPHPKIRKTLASWFVADKPMQHIIQTNTLYNSEFGQLTTAKISSWKSIFSIWSLIGTHSYEQVSKSLIINKIFEYFSWFIIYIFVMTIQSEDTFSLEIGPCTWVSKKSKIAS